MFPMMYPVQTPPPARPWLSWLIAAAMAALAAYLGLPKLPPIPGLPPITQPQPQPECPPKQEPPKPPTNPTAAIAQIQFGNAGCTAAPIAPRRKDGRWDVLTASHCVPNVGGRGTMVFKDGRRVGVTVAALDRTADWCWLTTDTADDLPYLTLAAASPKKGEAVWHAGYGIDKPTNREDGEATGVHTAEGQQEFVLSVSSGDSGGPVMLNSTNEVVTSVCCTQARGQRVPMYGSTTERIRAGRPATLSDEWIPVQMPECKK